MPYLKNHDGLFAIGFGAPHRACRSAAGNRPGEGAQSLAGAASANSVKYREIFHLHKAHKTYCAH